MIIRLCQQSNIDVIGTVRKEAQAELLRNEVGCKYVINTSERDWMQSMGNMA